MACAKRASDRSAGRQGLIAFAITLVIPSRETVEAIAPHLEMARGRRSRNTREWMRPEETLARVLDVPPEHVIRSSIGAHWQGVDAAEIVHPLDDFAVPALPRHVL